MSAFQLEGFHWAKQREREKVNFTDNISKAYTVSLNTGNNFS